MVLLIITSLLNILLFVLTITLLIKNNVSVEGTELLTILLMLATPIVNVIVLWVLRFKGGNQKGSIKDLRVRLERIEAALKQEPAKP